MIKDLNINGKIFAQYKIDKDDEAKLYIKTYVDNFDSYFIAIIGLVENKKFFVVSNLK